MEINKMQRISQMAQDMQRLHISAGMDAALSDAEKIYGKENNFSSQEGEKMDNDVDEIRKDVRKISFALRDALTELNELKIEHSKLQRDFNDMLVGQKPRQPPIATIPNQQFSYTPAPQHLPNLANAGATPVLNSQQQLRPTQPQMASEAQARLLEQLNSTNETKSLRDPTKAIDRNNVAPDEVKIENFFSFGKK